MARRSERPPAYRRRAIRGKEIAYITLRDQATGVRRDYWLGNYATTESRARYARLLAEWESRGRRLPECQGPARPAGVIAGEHNRLDQVSELVLELPGVLPFRGLRLLGRAIRVSRGLTGFAGQFPLRSAALRAYEARRGG